jgi:DNA (cytosine-5)-methyltransferase 1
MNRSSTRKKTAKMATAVDIFCGAGGLTRGLLDAKISVVAGYDIDGACEFPYEHNNSGAKFHEMSVAALTGDQLAAHYPQGHVRILVGCAPCTPFSKYTQGLDTKADKKWGLLHEFARLVRELKPDIVSMENVPELQRHSVFDDFLQMLRDEKFHFTEDEEKRVVFCPDYGLPQHRSRLVLVASRLGPIELIPPTHRPADYRKVSDVLRSLPALEAGDESADDPLHRTSRLSAKNLRRIQHSKPGGTWRDWPSQLVAKCHKKKSGETYPGVYGRMEWEKPAPTITTQFFGFGNGRFGHPTQDRAISLREGALLQSFPEDYEFVKPGQRYCFKTIGRLIGNAVPVRVGEVVGKTIRRHLDEHGH